MDHFVQTLRPYLDHYGYFAVFGALFLEDFGIPMPGETLLIAGALLATKGDLNILVLMLTAWCAAVLGDNVGYAIGRFGGRRLVLRFGKYILLTQKRLQYAENFFRRRGGIVVVVARFFEILRQLNGIVAGIAEMPWWRFVVFNALGAALWVGFWSMLFYFLGRQGARFGILFKRYEPYALAAAAIVIAVVVVIRVLTKRRHRRQLPDTPSPGADGE